MAPRWTAQEIFDLGYAVGMGLPAVDISLALGRPLGSVQMRMVRLKRHMNNRADGSTVIPVHVSRKTKAVIDACADVRGIGRRAMVERLMEAIGEEGEILFENILDEYR